MSVMVYGRSKRRALWILLAVGSLLMAAQAGADAYDAALARAIAAKERALDRNDPASWEDALHRFEEAARIRPTKEAKYELALAASQLRQDDLAVESYEAAVALGLEGSPLDKARAYLDEKAAAMGRVSIAGPPGTVIRVAQRQRTLPLERAMVLFPGSYALRWTVQGRESTRSVRIVAGEALTIDLESAHEGSSPPVGAGDRDRKDSVQPDRVLPWTLVGSGAGLVVVGGATVLGASLMLSSNRDGLKEVCAQLDGRDSCAFSYVGKQQEAQSKVDGIATAKAFRTGGWVGVGLGAGLAAVGGVLLLTDSGSETSVSIVPLPGLMSVSVAGTM
jgi:hypothetical protein